MPEGKRWVLIANYKDNSFLKNHISFFLCKKLGMDYTVRGEFVNLVLNGNYVGLYWFGEAVKVDINRVDIDTDKDFLLEIDSYFDEEWKFKSDIKAIPYNIRNDDTMSKERLEKLKTTINDFESKFYNDDGSVKSESEYKLSDYLDFDSMAKFYIVNELMRNIELHYMKSCFMTLDSTNILKAGPVWDMDSSCYVQDTVYKCKDSLYYDLLFTNSIFRKTVSDLLDGLFIEEILSEIRAFESKVYDSVKLDTARWGIHTDQDGKYRGDFFQSVDFVEKVITIRLNWLKAEF